MTNRYDSIDELPPHLREQARQKLNAQEKRKSQDNVSTGENKRSKYGSKTTEADGIKFASKGESRRYEVLKQQQALGVISELKLQPVYELQPTFRKNGKTHRSIKYIADFSYMRDGVEVIEDFKGYETEKFKIKRKLFEYKYPDKKLEVIKGKGD